jgi:hypothetical protein
VWSDLDGHVIGTRDLPLRIYLVLGPATFPEGGDEHQAWVAAIDPALRYIAGVEPTPQAVTSALVDYILTTSASTTTSSTARPRTTRTPATTPIRCFR